MANNKIQIKRSTTTAITNTTPSISAGELIFSSNGYILAIGDPANSANVISIGGARYPGVLTANQALVVNSSSSIDKINVANLVPTQIYANGGFGSAGQVLASNSTGLYWQTPTAGVAGSDTQVQFNDAGTLAGDSGFTYNKTTDTLTVANTLLVTTTVNSASIQAGTGSVLNTTGYWTTGTVNGATIQAGTGSVLNTTGYWTTGTVNGATLLAASTFVANATTLNANGFVVNSTGAYVTGLVNSTSFNAGAIGTGTGGSVQNTTTVFVGNNTINTNISATSLAVQNSTSTATLNPISLALGNSTVNSIANNSTFQITGNATTLSTVTLSGTGLTAGNSATTNGSMVIAVSNSTGNVQLTPTSFRVANSTAATFTANTTQVTIAAGITLSSNGGVGSSGQALLSNGATGSPYWSSIVNSITAANGLVGSATTGSVQLDIGAGAGISVAADSVAVLANSGIIANATGVFVNANNGIIANATGVYFNANTSQGLGVNATGAFVKTSATVIYDGTGNLAVNTAAMSFQDLTVSGNLTVLGDLVSLNVATLAIEDSLITLAKDQSSTGTFTDALDIGIFGTYGNTSNAFSTGLFRDQSDSGIWKLFVSNGVVTNTNVDTSNTTLFKLATLQTYLSSGGLTTNSTSANLIANSTYTVGIVANSLTLSTALGQTYGGTGKTTMTNNAILVGNSTNGYNELTLGTSGYVLQSNGTTVVYDVLDGGTF